MNNPQVVSMKPPTTLEGWQQCAVDLQRRRQANDAERGQIARKREGSALAAARGDATAQKQIAKLAQREAGLNLIAASLDQGLVIAVEEIGAREAQIAQENRRTDLARFREKLAVRSALVTDIEKQIRDMAPMLKRLAAITAEIDQKYNALGGARLTLPPLAQEAVGGRLAEFMAGSGFAEWLPVVRPEVRPAITSWSEAEQAAQQSYQFAA